MHLSTYREIIALLAMKTKRMQRHNKMDLEELFLTLKKHHLKITPPRKAILTHLFENHTPLLIDELHAATKDVCDVATVYRTLTSLVEIKMIRRCEFGDGIARYELIRHEDAHQHHLVCNKCKKISVIDLCNLDDSLNKIAAKRGFKDISHILEFFGTCPDCQ